MASTDLGTLPFLLSLFLKFHKQMNSLEQASFMLLCSKLICNPEIMVLHHHSEIVMHGLNELSTGVSEGDTTKLKILFKVIKNAMHLESPLETNQLPENQECPPELFKVEVVVWGHMSCHTQLINFSCGSQILHYRLGILIR